jgi:hypothetical protein
MQNELTIKWRVITAGVKRGLFGERQRAREKAAWFRAQGYDAKDVKVVRHIVKDRASKCAPAITGGAG